jgi:hypothetical protein
MVEQTAVASAAPGTGRVLVMALLLSTAAHAQTAPVLHKRTPDITAPPQTQSAPGYSTLPADASGEYELDDKSSIIQLTIERNRLTGYVTKIEGGTALTLFFEKASIDGSRIAFTTRTVHGLTYAFKGEIIRGEAVRPGQSGLYRLQGKLTADRNGTRQRNLVRLKSTPRTF